ncbi:MAG: amidoligase family protein [Armatimonadota bacterium]
MIDLRSLRFGVEVETVGRTRHQVAQAIQSVVGGEVTFCLNLPAYAGRHRWTARYSCGLQSEIYVKAASVPTGL